MEQKNKLEFLKKSNLKDLIEENLNPNQLIKELDPEKKLKLNYYSLRIYIEENFKKAWDKKSKRWINYVSQKNKHISNKYSPGQLNNLDIIDEQLKNSAGASNVESLDTSNINTLEETQPTIYKTKPEFSPESRHEETTKNNISCEDVHSRLNILAEKISMLECLYNETKNIIKAMDKKNKQDSASINNLIEIDEVIKLYTSSKNKKSININLELKDKVIEFIYEKYKFKDNESLAINIALLLALYKK